MKKCNKCGNEQAAEAIGFCVECLRTKSETIDLDGIHTESRRQFDLPVRPPRDIDGITCRRCANSCQLTPGSYGFCGIRYNRRGKLADNLPSNCALAHMYIDPLPTNCCAGWYCKGNKKDGYNLAVFFYGCNFDCLFCQNASHKYLKRASIITEDEMVAAALDKRVQCVCFFGGSPEPQLLYAIRVAQRIIAESQNKKHICWEWNGCGNQKLVTHAGKTAFISGGTIKFDLKYYHPNLAYAICGVNNKQSYNNFSTLADLYPSSDILTATTLLVPYYTDDQEVGEISKFIAERDRNIPYSLLVFHPDYYLTDLPITPKKQVQACYEEAKKYLNKVNIGNKHLLRYA
jgi:pyruvate formate lyase activating enzyme